MQYPLCEQAVLKLSKPVDAIVESGSGELLEAVVQGMKSAHRTGRNAPSTVVRLKNFGYKPVVFR